MPDGAQRDARPPTQALAINMDLTFSVNRITATVAHSDSQQSCIGPMVDNGAPYSEIGHSEMCALAHNIKLGWKGQIEPVSLAFHARPR